MSARRAGERILLNPELGEKVIEHARRRGVSPVTVIEEAIAAYLSGGSAERVLELLEDMRRLLAEQNALLRRLVERLDAQGPAVPTGGEAPASRETTVEAQPLPSFLAGNPWLEVLRSRYSGGSQ